MVLTANQVFQPDFYRSVYPDVAGFDNARALQHFLGFGIVENRQFSPLINLDYYRFLYPDIQGLDRRSLFEHLLTFGVNENRIFSPFVDLNYYKTLNRDLLELSNEKALEHLIGFGINEGRDFSPNVNLNYYKIIHPDLSGLTNEEAFEHLIVFGINEGRSFFPPTEQNITDGLPNPSDEGEIPQSPNDADSLAAGDNSLLNGTEGNDTLLALGGNSTLVGSQGNDSLFAANGTGNNLLQGSIGDNILVAGTNTDTLMGGSGNDFFVGSEENDTLRTNPPGNDTLEGFLGADSLVGTAGVSDRFLYQTPAAEEGNDTITLFETGTDRFYLKLGANQFNFNADGIAGLRTNVDFFAVSSRTESYTGTFAIGGTQPQVPAIVFDAQPGEGGILYYDPSGGGAPDPANPTGDTIAIATIERGSVNANDIIIF